MEDTTPAPTLKLRTCPCGWVHFGVTRAYAEEQVAKFNEFYHRSPPETQASYAGPVSIKRYEQCFSCGFPHTEFRGAKEGDCPRGVTLNPIIVEGA